MKKYVQKHWFEFFFVFIVTFMACVGISVVFGYCFRSNDDAMLRNIVSGNYTGTPDAHLIYIMYPLGLLWKCLYMAFPTIPWYDLFMIGLHYLCWFMLLFRIQQQFVKKSSKLISVVLGLGALVIIDFPYLVMHHYTILAAVSATVAIFWLATSKNKNGLEYWLDRVVCIIFLVLCLWLRKQVFLMALPVGFFVLVLEMCDVKKGQIKKEIKKTALFLVCVLSICIVSFAIEKIAYSSPEWKDFSVYNEARTDIYDFYGIPPYQSYEQQYKELDISYGEWVAIDHYDGGLVSGLDSEILSAVAVLSKQNFDAIRETYSVCLQIFYSVFEVVLYNDVQPIGIILTVVYVVSLWNCYKKREKSSGICICLLLLFQALFVGYFIGQQRFPEHVSYGLYLMASSFLAAILLRQKDSENKRVLKEYFWMALLLIVCVSVMGAMGIYRARTTLSDYQRVISKAEDWRYINKYFEEHNDATYCIITKSFVFSTEEMFADGPLENSNVVRLGSWIQNSPLEDAHNKKAGVDVILDSLISENNVYIVQQADCDTEWITVFMDGSGYENVSVEVVDVVQTPGGLTFQVLNVQ